MQPHRSSGATQRQNASFSGGRSLKHRHYGGLTTSATTNNSKTRVQGGPSEDGIKMQKFSLTGKPKIKRTPVACTFSRSRPASGHHIKTQAFTSKRNSQN